MQKAVAWGVSAILAAGVVATYYAWRSVATHEVALPSVAPAAERASPLLESPKPAIEHPIERVPRTADAPPAATPLPALDASDAEFHDTLSRLIGRAAVVDFIQPEQMIRNIVATVDNLPRKTLAPRLNPVKPIPGPFIASGNGDRLTLSTTNVSRYVPYVTALEAVDAHKLAAVYAYFYPLFQQAYRDLGYPNGYFNDRLIEAIDDMLATPEMREPVALAQPRVLYQFADPDLEALSAGQKIMLRMGPDNAAHVKAKLAEIRRALTGDAAPSTSPAHAGAVNAPSAPARSSTTTSGG